MAIWLPLGDPDLESTMEAFASALKSQRVAAGLTLEELFQRTRINIEFLEAIEVGSFDILPKVYVRLFLKKYAQEVGLNAEETLKQYELCSQPKAREISTEPQRRELSSKVSILAAMGVLAVVLVAGVALMGDQDTPEPVQPDRAFTPKPKRTVPPAAKQTEIVEAAEGVTAKPAPDSEDLPQDEKIEVTHKPSTADRVVSAYSLSLGFPISRQDSILILSAVATAATGVSIRADEESVFEGLLTVGSQRTWEARTRIRVEIEKSGAVVLSLQGHPLKPLGKPGRKLRLFISRASIWVEEIEPANPAAAR